MSSGIVKIFFFLCFSVVSITAWSANETIKDVAVTQISSYKEYAVIYISPAYVNSQVGCEQNKSKIILEYASSDVDAKGLFSLLLAGVSAGKSVQFGISGCYGDYPKVYRVDVKY